MAGRGEHRQRPTAGAVLLLLLLLLLHKTARCQRTLLPCYATTHLYCFFGSSGSLGG